MNKYTNEQIAASLSLWNEYFNTDGAMTDEEFYETSEEDRLAFLNECYPE